MVQMQYTDIFVICMHMYLCIISKLQAIKLVLWGNFVTTKALYKYEILSGKFINRLCVGHFYSANKLKFIRSYCQQNEKTKMANTTMIHSMDGWMYLFTFHFYDYAIYISFDFYCIATKAFILMII